MQPVSDHSAIIPLYDVTVANYTFGAPKNGNWIFGNMYDKLVPNTFRTVVDGDIVVGLPPTWSYRHVGTEVLVDPLGAGSVIIDPSFVERRLRTSVRSSISVHAMSVYKRGIDGVYDASSFLQQASMSGHDETFDSLRLALSRKPVPSSVTSKEWEALGEESWHANVALQPFEVHRQHSSTSVVNTYCPDRKGRADVTSTHIYAHDGHADEEWGYEMDVSSRCDMLEEGSDSNGDAFLKTASDIPSSPHTRDFASSESCDNSWNNFSRMALAVDMDSNEVASLSPLLDLTLAQAKRAVSLMVDVPNQLLQNVLIRTGIRSMDEQELKNMMSSSVPRRTGKTPTSPLTSSSAKSDDSQWSAPNATLAPTE